MLRRLALFLLAAATFLGVTRAIAPLVPWPEEYGLRAKWEWFEEHKDDYNAIFIGSSATFYGIVPGTFDRILTERGYEMRSFNFGVGGMSSLEADHTLRRVLELEPANLEYVFVESAGWDARVYETVNTYSPRMLRWHNVEHTRIALECLTNIPAPAQGEDWRWRSAQLHGELFLRNLTSALQGPRIAGKLTGSDTEEIKPTPEELERLSGYVDLDVIDEAEWDRRRERFLSEPDAYIARVKAIGPGNKQPLDVNRHANLPRLREQIAAIQDTGAKAVYYTAPRAAAMPMSHRLGEAGIFPAFFGYNRPGKYPELYMPEAHFDPNHLNRKGAETFTSLFANDFADHLDGQGE